MAVKLVAWWAALMVERMAELLDAESAGSMAAKWVGKWAIPMAAMRA